jgi:sugar phosphate isomerase/epimerase
MKNQNKGQVSRRTFIGTAASAAVAVSIIPLSYQYKGATRTATVNKKPDSNFGGVQIGINTLSLGVTSDIDGTIKACVDAGVSSIELRYNGVEEYLGAPKNPIAPAPRPAATAGQAPAGATGGGGAGGVQSVPLTPEQQAAQDKYNADLKAWRLSEGTIAKYEGLRKKFNDAGLSIHIFSLPAGNSDEERDFSFKASKALGASASRLGILLTDSYKSLVPFAEKNGIYIIFHNVNDYADPKINVDAILDFSPACKLQFDVGHYYGSTGLNPCDFIEKYHDRIFSLHLNDCTGPTNKNISQVWGQGETPIIETLQLIKKKKWPISCDIEMDYALAPWSNRLKEAKTCVAYCRQALS